MLCSRLRTLFAVLVVVSLLSVLHHLHSFPVFVPGHVADQHVQQGAHHQRQLQGNVWADYTTAAALRQGTKAADAKVSTKQAESPRDTRPAQTLQDARSASEKRSEKMGQFARHVLGYTEWPDQCGSRPGFSQPLTVPQYDLTKEGSLQFLREYRNPCWRGLKSEDLLCLPSFYLGGFPKCGTTDMFMRIVQHPEVVADVVKEPHWITRARFHEGGRSQFQFYADLFGQALKRQNSTVHVIGDGSASTLWDNDHWSALPGNERCTEPRVINADYVTVLNPDVKIIVMLRNPTARLYSEYMFFPHGGTWSQEDFDRRVVQSIAHFRQCRLTHSLRYCAYNNSLHSVRLHIGLYSVFVEDWLLRVPRDQMIFIRTEDVGLGAEVMAQVFSFLDLKIPDKTTMGKILSLGKQNTGTRSQKRGAMWNQTRRLLDDFYRPFNHRLASILQDPRFAWP